jgi:hypothetical protein
MRPGAYNLPATWHVVSLNGERKILYTELRGKQSLEAAINKRV